MNKYFLYQLKARIPWLILHCLVYLTISGIFGHMTPDSWGITQALYCLSTTFYMLVMIILMVVFQYRYKVRSTERILYLSLPIKKEKLDLFRMIAGVIEIVVPFLLCLMLPTFLYSLQGFNKTYRTYDPNTNLLNQMSVIFFLLLCAIGHYLTISLLLSNVKTAKQMVLTIIFAHVYFCFVGLATGAISRIFGFHNDYYAIFWGKKYRGQLLGYLEYNIRFDSFIYPIVIFVITSLLGIYSFLGDHTQIIRKYIRSPFQIIALATAITFPIIIRTLEYSSNGFYIAAVIVAALAIPYCFLAISCKKILLDLNGWIFYLLSIGIVVGLYFGMGAIVASHINDIATVLQY